MCNANVISLEREETVTDEAVAENIERFLKSLKSSGRRDVNMLDLLMEFSYPSEQIDRVMSLLEKKGIVKEDWPPW